MSKFTNALKLTAAAASFAILAGCASDGADKTTLEQVQSEASQANSTANKAMNTANQAQRDARAAMQMSHENRQAMDRMFDRSMRK